jgi:hypothetical protein
MPTWLASLLAALIGAGAGSIGAVLTSDWRKQKAERSERRAAFVQRYLFQLQDACETLWYRLDNVSRRGGRLVMDDEYFETTTLYALGRVLAIERFMALEGAYPQLEPLYPGLGDFLMRHRIDYGLSGTGFNQYDRITLGEAVAEREGDRFRTSTYLEFRRRYESQESREKEWLAPARNAVQSLPEWKTDGLKEELQTIALRISHDTGTLSGFESGPEDASPSGS